MTKQTACIEGLKATGAKSSAAAKPCKATTKIVVQPHGDEKSKLSRSTKSSAPQMLPTKTRTASLACHQKVAVKSKPARNTVSVSKPHPVTTRKPPADRSVSTITCQKAAMDGSHTEKPTLRSAMRVSNSAVAKKQVQFIEGPIKPHVYPCNNTAKLPTLPLARLLRSKVVPADSGNAQLFEGTGQGCLTLKHRFLNRYASVQAYEARRREEALAKGEQPGLGQLDYGNADFKIALQASKAIEAHDIGTLQDLSTLGKLGALKNDGQQTGIRVWVFGSFKEPYLPAAIPTKRVAAHKKPLRWPVTRCEQSLDAFVKRSFKCLQPAHVAT